MSQRMNWVCTLARNVFTEAQWTLLLSCHQSTVMLLWLQGLLLHVAAPVIYYSACQHLFMLLALQDFLSTPDICSLMKMTAWLLLWLKRDIRKGPTSQVRFSDEFSIIITQYQYCCLHCAVRERLNKREEIDLG